MRKRARFKSNTKPRLLKAFLLAFILLVFVSIFFFFKKGVLNIKQIEVQGSVSCVNESDLKNISGLLGANYFRVDGLKIENQLKRKFFCIKSTEVSKIFPDKTRLKVLNRTPVAVLATIKTNEASTSGLIENIATSSSQQVKDYYLVDEEGVVFDKSINTLNTPQIFLSNYEIFLGQKLTNELTSALKILEQVKIFGIEAGNSLIDGNTFIINSHTLSQKIIFLLNNKVDVQLASLQLILDKAKINRRTIPPLDGTDSTNFEFIDLRFDKPVVKFAPKK